MSTNRCPYCAGVVESFRQADDFTEAGECIYVTRYWCEDCGVVDDADAPPCGSCGDPGPYTITLRGEPMPACLRHLNHWRAPSCPDCGGLNGQHGSVHVRYGNGGGGNHPCRESAARST